MNWIDTPGSSNIARFRYAEDTSVLTVEIKNGGRYNYYDVPVMVFEGMRAATSKGAVSGHTIKGQYRYARV